MHTPPPHTHSGKLIPMPATPAATLNESFALPGVLHFEDAGALQRAQITLPTCAATVYLQGAHLTHWQPAGQAPALFLSADSDFAPGKAIRGGIPLCFPWFGPRGGGLPGPSHGFARIQDWTLANAALLPGEQPTLHLTFTLGPTDLSRSLGFDHFRVAYELIFGANAGRTLTLRLSVANLAPEPLPFEEALHTYFAIADVRTTPIAGLSSAPYLDKTDGAKQKTTPAGDLTLTATTDRVFPGHTAPVSLHDAGNQRVLTNTKQNSATTVLWNPWAEVSATFSDLPNDAWPGFVCVETANTGAEKVTLAPNQAHTMEAVVSVQPA